MVDVVEVEVAANDIIVVVVAHVTGGLVIDNTLNNRIGATTTDNRVEE